MVYTTSSMEIVSSHEDLYLLKGTRTHVGLGGGGRGGEEPGTLSYSRRLDE